MLDAILEVTQTHIKKQTEKMGIIFQYQIEEEIYSFPRPLLLPNPLFPNLYTVLASAIFIMEV